MFWTFGDFIDPDSGEIVPSDPCQEAREPLDSIDILPRQRLEAQGGSYTIVMDPDRFTRPLDGRTLTRQRTASRRRLTG